MKTLSLSFHYKPKSIYRIVLTREPYCPAYIYIYRIEDKPLFRAHDVTRIRLSAPSGE